MKVCSFPVVLCQLSQPVPEGRSLQVEGQSVSLLRFPLVALVRMSFVNSLVTSVPGGGALLVKSQPVCLESFSITPPTEEQIRFPHLSI